MKTSEILARQLEQALAREAAIEAKFGVEPTRIGAVLVWRMRFGHGQTRYDYAAILAGDGRWYTTGPRSPKGYTWDELTEWLARTDHKVTKFRRLR